MPPQPEKSHGGCPTYTHTVQLSLESLSTKNQQEGYCIAHWTPHAGPQGFSHTGMPKAAASDWAVGRALSRVVNSQAHVPLGVCDPPQREPGNCNHDPFNS